MIDQDRYEKAATWIAAAFFFALLAGMAFAQPPVRKAAAEERAVLRAKDLGLASVSEEGDVTWVPRDRVEAFLAQEEEDIAALKKRVAAKEAAVAWVRGTVLTRYPTPTPTPTPAPSPTPNS